MRSRALKIAQHPARVADVGTPPPDIGARRVLLLAAGMALGTAALWSMIPLRFNGGAGSVEAAAVATLVIFAEFFTVDLYVGRETHTVSFRTIPLVVGLFILSPVLLLLAYVVGAGAVIALRDRPPRLKMIFNAALFMLEVVVAIAIFHLAGSEEISRPQTWLAAIVAAVAIDLLGGGVVNVAIWLHQGRSEARGSGWLVLSGALAAGASACLAVVAVLLMSIAPASLALLAAIGAFMIAAYRSYALLRQRHSELEVLQDYTTALGRTKAFEEVAVCTLREARARLDASRAELWYLPPGGDSVGVRVTFDGDRPAIIDPQYRIPITDPLWGRLVSGVAALVISRDDRRPEARALLARYGCNDLVAAPLRGERGLVGILLLRNRLGDVATFEARDGRLLGALSRYTSIALENGRLVDELQSEAARREHEALHDSLTGLPNRRLFHERGPKLLQLGTPQPGAAVMLLDLDLFKAVNDTFGHASGDAVLVEVAQRLRELMPPSALLARFGGDEFAILLPGVESRESAVAFAAEIRETLAKPHLINGVAVYLDVSTGIALFPTHGPDITTLLRAADVAMYEAKEGRRESSVYSPSHDNHTPERLALAAELRTALADGTFGLSYQPIRELATDRVVGVEVLGRWQHPTRGLLPPPMYVAIAEQSGLIHELTSYVLENALEQRRQWASRGLDLSVAVNISVHDLHRDGFATDVAEVLDRTATPPGRLVLEVTETRALHSPERIAPVLAQLRGRGVVVAIDDFGTGFSSLTSLRSLPVDVIKIDRAFVGTMAVDEHDNAIVRSIIELARRLGIEIVAEGVEDEETEGQLRALGCNKIQGYVMTPALPPHQLEKWLGGDAEKARRAPVLDLQPVAVG
jgi:diguanylate cyclase (GGDEF)-like protein